MLEHGGHMVGAAGVDGQVVGQFGADGVGHDFSRFRKYKGAIFGAFAKACLGLTQLCKTGDDRSSGLPA